MMSDPEIRVLVAYTSNAKNDYSGNINSLITLAEGNMNDAFTTSGVNADINVVHTAEISYNESSNNELNLCRLTTSETFTPGSNCTNYSSGQLQGYMNQIHNWRYQHDADLVVLITGPNTGTGIGWLGPFSSQYGFSIARYDWAVSMHTMAHEIGHNLGAAHNLAENDPEVYSYGHGYVYDPAQWVTILSYPPSGYTRINRYSNPNKNYAGVATGTAQYEDNARAINNRTSLVAGFDPPSPPTIHTHERNHHQRQ